MDQSTNISTNNTALQNETLDINDYYWFYQYDLYAMLLSIPMYRAYMTLMDILPYLLITMVCLSVVGNVLITIVVLQAKNRRHSISIYIASLAIADLFINLGFSLPNFLYMKGYISESHSMFDCKFRSLIPVCSEYVSVWTLSIISIERAISVNLPHKIKSMCNINRAKGIVAISWVTGLMISTGIAMISVHIEFPNGLMKCTILPEAEIFYRYFYYRFYSITVFLVPFSVVLTCTIIILFKITRRPKITSNEENVKHVVSSVTRALLLVNIAFLLLFGPMCIFYLLESFDFFENYISPSLLSEKLFARSIFSVMIDFNSVLNFFVYFFSGARFRNDLFEFLAICKKRQLPSTTLSFKLESSRHASKENS